MNRLLLASAEFLPYRGGVAEVVAGFAEALSDSSRFRCTVLTVATREGSQVDRSYEVVRLPWTEGIDHRKVILLLSLRLMSVLLRRRYDCVLSLDLLTQRALSVLPARLLSRLPIFLYVHGSEVLQHRQGKRAWRRARLFKSVSGVVCNSRYTQNLVSEYFSTKSVKVVYPGIREVAFAQNRESRGEARRALGELFANLDEHLILCIGRLDERKGQDVAIRMTAALRRLGQSVQLALVGSGAWRPVLQALARSHGIEDRVTFLETADDRLKFRLIDGSIFTIQPSRRVGEMVEGLGLALAEAGARGRVVLSSDHGGIPEVVLHERTGILLPENASDEMWTRSALDLLLHEKKRIRLEAGAEAWVKSRFQWQRACQDILAVLEPVGRTRES